VTRTDTKLQRWIDLLAALLQHRFGATFADLRSLVPAYGGDKDATTLARMFERDKDELRALGLPIRVRDEETEDGLVQRYYIKAAEMYLPYLALAAASTTSTPPHVPPAGYRSVPTLAFEPDELSVLIRAAEQTRKVDDPAISHDAASALRKLTFDLGIGLGSVAGESEKDAAKVPEPAAAATVCVVGDALLRRKRVNFVYASMSSGATDERSAEPFGLSFSSGHWYLIGRDVVADSLRSFRVSRMSRVTPNAKKPQSPDYAIPANFDLAAYASLKEPWELGDETPEEMVIEIRRSTGASMTVQALGTAAVGNNLQRRFQVRRVDSFARWVMSFAGDVVPVSPPRLCAEYQSIVASTLAIYTEKIERAAT